ncbi:MAG: TlpA disulfide reductase family protein [Spirochaetia bacterium]
MRQGIRSRSFAGFALGLAAVVMLASCSHKESSATPAEAQSAPPPATLPGSLVDQLKKSGFAVAAKPFAAEDFTLANLDGSKASLSSFKGKVVFLSFWATWCGPCKQELPSIEALYQKLSSRGLVVLAVDIAEEKGKVAQFVKANSLTFPILLDGNASVGSSWGANSIPTNYLLDRSGRVIARIVGFDGTDWTSRSRMDLFDKILSM